MTYFNIERSKRTPETEIDVILTNISVLYDDLVPDQEPYTFINVVFKMMIENGESGDKLANSVDSSFPVNDDGVGKASRLMCLFVACAYCCDAQRAFDDGRIDEAWTFVIDAKDWLRVPMSLHPGIGKLKEAEHRAEVSKVRREARKNGVKKYAIEYDYSDFVLSEYKSQPWKNKTKAVNEINTRLIKHIADNKLPVRNKHDVVNGAYVTKSQEDFTSYIGDLLPTAEEVKLDRDNWKSPV